MSEKPISDLRRRMLEDMAVRKFGEKTRHDYIKLLKALDDLGITNDTIVVYTTELWPDCRTASLATTRPKNNRIGKEVVSHARLQRFDFHFGLPGARTLGTHQAN